MCSTRQRLAALLKEERESQGLTLRQAAYRAQLAPSTLSRWEAGACVPRVPELEALLKSLEVHPDNVKRILVSLDAPRAAKALRGDDSMELLAPSGGFLLRALRHKAGYSLSQVATSLGVATSTVSRWEAAAAHPTPEACEDLLVLLGASEEERRCVQLSGVGKIRAERPPFDPDRYAAELWKIESSLPEGGTPGTELRLIELQSLIWWSLEHPRAKGLLGRAYLLYGKHLMIWERFHEALAQGEKALELSNGKNDPLAAEALRVIARCDVYRWQSARPHLGLYTLQPLLNSLVEPALRAPVLADMADYSRMAKRHSDALGYAYRSIEAAEGCGDADVVHRARMALGSACAEVGDRNLMKESFEPEPTETAPLRAERLMRSAEAWQALRKTDKARQAFREAREFATKHRLSHLNPGLGRLEVCIEGYVKRP